MNGGQACRIVPFAGYGGPANPMIVSQHDVVELIDDALATPTQNAGGTEQSYGQRLGHDKSFALAIFWRQFTRFACCRLTGMRSS